MQVYILDASGRPLMPTTRIGHIERLLNRGMARIVTKVPFTVQLKYATAGITQPLYGGTDSGRTNIGEAVVDNNGSVLYKAHVETRNKEVPKLMAARKQHRQASRRGERLRKKRRAVKCGTITEFPEGHMIPGCKKPVMIKDIINTESRFANRKRVTGWITPTVRQLVQTHLNMVHKICRILPITDWTIETNRFAFMKMDDGGIRGVDFQNGRLKNYKDSHEYIYSIQEGKCAYCNSSIEHYHHIVPRSKGGSDTPENLIGLCNLCHDKVHKGELSLENTGLKKKYAALSVLNQAIPYIIEGLVEMFGEENVHFCEGYETQMARDSLGIDKDHPEDAACIALLGSGITEVHNNVETCEIRQFRRHDRQHIKAQRERTYYLNGKAVCKNRHKRFEQKDDSLEEFRKKHPSDVKRLTVKKSVRYYNAADRLMPGTVFSCQGQRQVMSGQLTGGKYLRAVGDIKTNYPSSQCLVLKRNAGLVYL
ncbi:RRXRR domain-containing protein [Butyrivibrio sp.]|uniref:RRXRR domain-containing protein n=1 Tax=Butyrivibrio sp. TaxID=28121 RepID=UPI0025BE6FB7|nr:RRXRR domain-containing protein [Butyrivibrio sp.]MBQ7430259.1 HNH endonuclease [Butyrivibrio sp.]MBQ9303433.1 HNH endonuclease [Butyrivibrio sp.]